MDHVDYTDVGVRSDFFFHICFKKNQGKKFGLIKSFHVMC